LHSSQGRRPPASIFVALVSSGPPSPSPTPGLQGPMRPYMLHLPPAPASCFSTLLKVTSVCTAAAFGALKCLGMLHPHVVGMFNMLPHEHAFPCRW
jgi:hypothetical protein